MCRSEIWAMRYPRNDSGRRSDRISVSLTTMCFHPYVRPVMPAARVIAPKTRPAAMPAFLPHLVYLWRQLPVNEKNANTVNGAKKAMMRPDRV